MNRIGLKLQLRHAHFLGLLLMLLFALSGKANANGISLSAIWSWDNPNQTVGPTDSISMFGTLTNTGAKIDQISTPFISDGTLIRGPDQPYVLTFGKFPFTNLNLDTGKSINFLFATLDPFGGLAPFDTFKSPFASLVIQYTGALGSQSLSVSVSNSPFTVNVVPEPSTMLLLASGLAGLAAWRRRKRGA